MPVDVASTTYNTFLAYLGEGPKELKDGRVVQARMVAGVEMHGPYAAGRGVPQLLRDLGHARCAHVSAR